MGGPRPVSTGMKPALLVVAVVLFAVAGAGCVVSVDSQGQIVREEKRFKVEGAPDLRLATFDGSIEIQSWDRPDVVVEVEKRGATREAVDAIKVTATQEGRRIEVDVRSPRRESFTGFGLHRSASARLIVWVPERLTLVARSGDGSIRVERLNGQIELRTSDGGIRASHVSGDITLNTGDGSITVDNAQGRLNAETGDGGVNVAGRLSAVKMHTGDGSIVCRAEPGAIMAEDWQISTGDGGVALYLPESFAADIDAHTGDGTIRNDLDITPAGSGGEVSRRTIRGRLGAGGKLLRIRTGDGGIRLRAF